jgi:hypothetical protein
MYIRLNDCYDALIRVFINLEKALHCFLVTIIHQVLYVAFFIIIISNSSVSLKLPKRDSAYTYLKE